MDQSRLTFLKNTNKSKKPNNNSYNFFKNTKMFEKQGPDFKNLYNFFIFNENFKNLHNSKLNTTYLNKQDKNFKNKFFSQRQFISSTIITTNYF